MAMRSNSARGAGIQMQVSGGELADQLAAEKLQREVDVAEEALRLPRFPQGYGTQYLRSSYVSVFGSRSSPPRQQQPSSSPPRASRQR